MTPRVPPLTDAAGDDVRMEAHTGARPAHREGLGGASGGCGKLRIEATGGGRGKPAKVVVRYRQRGIGLARRLAHGANGGGASGAVVVRPAQSRQPAKIAAVQVLRCVCRMCVVVQTQEVYGVRHDRGTRTVSNPAATPLSQGTFEVRSPAGNTRRMNTGIPSMQTETGQFRGARPPRHKGIAAT